MLLERGATDIPSVPWLDPSAARLPGGLRLLVVGGTLLVAVGLMAAWTATLPIDAPSDDELCDATRRLIEPTDLAYHLGLTLDRCEVRDGAIAFRGCVTLDQGLIDRLQAEPDPYAVAWLRRFSAAPTPGRHCSPAPVPLAEAVVTPRRPWTVRLAPPSTP